MLLIKEKKDPVGGGNKRVVEKMKFPGNNDPW